MKRWKAAFISGLLILALSGCSEKAVVSDNQAEPETVSETSSDVKKPERIRILASTIMDTKDNFEAVQKKFKENTGIELVITYPDHNTYYEKANIAVASNYLYDVIEVGGAYYPTYSSFDLLWDMTDAWESSSIKENVNEQFVDALKIDGHLYGFPIMRGNGTMTHVRKDLLDKAGLDIPQNYEQFIDMLRAFKSEVPIPLTAPGVINTEFPYDIYMKEFYQDANPDFYRDSSGKFVDGMLQPQMKDAIIRMQTAYSDGLIDPDIFSNKTSTCRDKVYEGQVGVFNYWAGSWSKVMADNVRISCGGELIPIPAIEECTYVERNPVAMVIPKFCDNPEGVFKYFIEYTHDSAEGQTLFTYGTEGIIWEYDENGKMKLINDVLKSPAKLYYTPELSITEFDDPIEFPDIVKQSMNIFEQNSELRTLPISTDTSTSMMPEIDIAKRDALKRAVIGEITADEAIESYKSQVLELSEQIVKEMQEESNK